MAKTLIATPLLDGRADRQFVSGLVAATAHYHAWAAVDGVTNISAARDVLAAQFLDSDCDQLVFIDSDIGFEAEDLCKLLASPHALIGGLYTRKQLGSRWLFTPLSGHAYDLDVPDVNLPVRHVAAGFLRIDRSVFAALRESGKCPKYRLQGRYVMNFFPTVVNEGLFLSEDYGFCELAASVGHVPHIHGGVRLRHIGRYIYEGARPRVPTN